MKMITAFLVAAVKAGTPLLFGTTGEIITERAGSLNLGVEGMMCMGAICGFYTGYTTNSLFLALIAAILAGAAGALIYAFLTITMKANQNVVGLALTIFGQGFSSFFGQMMISKAPNGIKPALPQGIFSRLSDMPIPLLSKIPFVGEVLFSHSILVYIAVITAILCGLFLSRTRTGLNLRSVGENPAAADAAGINVDLVRYISTVVGGGICGLGGAYLALVGGGGQWNNGCVDGHGWIAVALVIFAGWSPFKAILGSLIFGAFSVLQFYAPKDVLHIPNAFYVMLPFVVTAVVLVFTSMRKTKEGAQPKSCGLNYFREER